MANRRAYDDPFGYAEGGEFTEGYTEGFGDTQGDFVEPQWNMPGEHVGGPVGEPVDASQPQGQVIDREPVNHPASRFTADQQAGYVEQAKEYGADDSWIQDFLGRNNDDWNRLGEAFLPTSHRPYDSQTQDPWQLAQNKAADKASGSPLGSWWGGGGDPLKAFGGGSGSGSGGGFGPSGGSSGGGSSSGGSTSGSSSSSPQDIDSIMAQLQKLFPDGAYNEDIVNRRTESARENMERFRKSRMANTRAQLADRGLIGDGPEATGIMNIESDMADDYQRAASDIFANESENADQRMIQALTVAAGLSTDEAKLIIERFRAENDANYQTGQLALGNKTADNNFTLGQGNLALGNSAFLAGNALDNARLGFDQDKWLWEQDNWSIEKLIEVLKAQGLFTQTANNGFQG
jgi:hypothetical protein